MVHTTATGYGEKVTPRGGGRLFGTRHDKRERGGVKVGGTVEKKTFAVWNWTGEELGGGGGAGRGREVNLLRAHSHREDGGTRWGKGWAVPTKTLGGV